MSACVTPPAEVLQASFLQSMKQNTNDQARSQHLSGYSYLYPTGCSGTSLLPYVHFVVSIVKSRKAGKTGGMDDNWEPGNLSQALLLQPEPQSRLQRWVCSL
jgi:hypothetical protein